MTAPFHLNFTRWNGELKLRQKYAFCWFTQKWRNKEQIVSLTHTYNNNDSLYKLKAIILFLKSILSLKLYAISQPNL